MITWKTGDLFTSGATALAHGCNCRGLMGAGIAAQFRQRWPRMYAEYNRRCLRSEFLPGDAMIWHHETGTIFNLATQDEPGPCAEPWMITAAVGSMITLASFTGIQRVAMPLIGCGIGGLAKPNLKFCLAPYENAPINLDIYELPDPL